MRRSRMLAHALVTALVVASFASVGLAGAATADSPFTAAQGAASAPAAALATRPVVAVLAPTSGPETGGTVVTVEGAGFVAVQRVEFGSDAGTDVRVLSPTRLTVVAPRSRSARDVRVRVITAAGTSRSLAATTFTYLLPPSVSALAPPAGPLAGGTRIIVNGERFGPGTALYVGDVQARAVEVLSPTRLTAVTPAVANVRSVKVQAAYESGGRRGTSSVRFDYLPRPEVRRLRPASGPVTGGQLVTLTGRDLRLASAVHFGAVPGTDLTVLDDRHLTVHTPASGSGPVPVTVTTPGGKSLVTAAGSYLYVGALPTVTSMTPDAGSIGGGATVTLVGTDLQNATSVLFGAAEAIVLDRTPTSLRVLTPPGLAPGDVPVSVVSSAGTTTDSPTSFTYVAADSTCSDIATDTTWTRERIRILDCLVTVAPGATLTVASGVVVKLGPGGGIVVPDDASLRVAGTSTAPVTVSSTPDDAAGGDTNGDGPSSGAWGDYDAAVLLGAGGTVEIGGAVLRFGRNAVRTLPQPGGTATLRLTDSSLRSRVLVDAAFAVRTTVERVGFTVDRGEPLVLRGQDPSGIALSGDTSARFAGSGAARALVLSDCLLPSGAAWKVDASSGAVLTLTDPLSGTAELGRLDIRGDLTLLPGTVVKLAGHPEQSFREETYGLLVRDGGSLTANGTTDAPVVLTSVHDDSVAGDTDGNGPSAPTQYGAAVTVRSAGAAQLTGVRVDHAWHAVLASLAGDQPSAGLTVLDSVLHGQVYLGGNLAPSVRRTVVEPSAGPAFQVYSVRDPSGLAFTGPDAMTFPGAGQARAVRLAQTLPGAARWILDSSGGAVFHGTVGALGALTLSPGTILKGSLSAASGGTVDAVGTDESPIVVTVEADDVPGGDTNGDASATTPQLSSGPGVSVAAGGAARLQKVLLRHQRDCLVAQGPSYASFTRSSCDGTVSAFGRVELTVATSHLAPASGPAVRLIGTDPSGIVLTGPEANNLDGAGIARVVRVDGGTVAADRIWRLAGAAGGVVVAGDRLVVAGQVDLGPGAVLKLTGLGRIRVDGRLTGAGPTVMTSLRDDSVAGDSGDDGATPPAAGDYEVALELGPTGRVSVGGLDQRFGRDALVTVPGQTDLTGAALTLHDSTLRARLVVERYFSVAISLQRNSFTPEAGAPMLLRNQTVDGILLTGPDANRFPGDGPARAVFLDGCRVPVGATWTLDPASGAVVTVLNYAVDVSFNGTLTVAGTLEILPGSVVKLSGMPAGPFGRPESPGIEVVAGGRLLASGTPGAGITLTGYTDDTAGGDTDGMGASEGVPYGGAVTLRAGSRAQVTGTTFAHATTALLASTAPDVAPIVADLVGNTFLSTVHFEGQQTLVTVRGNTFHPATGPALHLLHLPRPQDVDLAGAMPNLFPGSDQARAVHVSLEVPPGSTVTLSSAHGAIFAGTVGVQGHLVVAPGTVLKNTGHVTLGVAEAGRLDLLGSPDDPIVLTDILDDQIEGDTNGDGRLTRPTPGEGGTLLDVALGAGAVPVQHVAFRYAKVGVHVGPLVKLVVRYSQFSATEHAVTVDEAGGAFPGWVDGAVSTLPCLPPWASYVDAAGNWFGAGRLPGADLDLSPYVGKFVPPPYKSAWESAAATVGVSTAAGIGLFANRIPWALYDCGPVTFPITPVAVLWPLDEPPFPDLLTEVPVEASNSLPPLPDGCPKAFFIGAAGSGESGEGDYVARIRAQVQAGYGPGELVPVTLQYPATAVPILPAHDWSDPALTLEVSELGDFLVGARAGVANLVNTLLLANRKCENAKIVLAGYSQGAWVIHDALRILGSSQRLDDTLAAVALVADPERLPGVPAQLGTADPEGRGIAALLTDPWVISGRAGSVGVRRG